jgi:LysM repeat protein
LVVLVALLLSGCFRPSGDTIEPTSPGATADTIQQPASNATATPEAPPITLLSPDVTAAPTLEQATQAGPALTEVTVIPFESTSTPTALSGSVTPTLQFITPGISLGLVTPETATAAPPPTVSSEQLDTLLPEDNTGDDTGDDTGDVSSTGVELVSGAECTYTVEPGDNLYRISILNDTTVNALMEANPNLVGDPPILQPGQVLALPDCTPGSSGTSATPAATLRADSTAIPAEQETYRVQPGDTLMAIANRYRTSVNALMEANNLADPNILSIGQVLVIPRDEDDGE